ncbi:MAG: hypothetical protein KDK40_05190, partial [Chlamydiia bacterium]|nr:hypothetical protein [Chlamydiia bacterium]
METSGSIHIETSGSIQNQNKEHLTYHSLEQKKMHEFYNSALSLWGTEVADTQAKNPTIFSKAASTVNNITKKKSKIREIISEILQTSSFIDKMENELKVDRQRLTKAGNRNKMTPIFSQVILNKNLRNELFKRIDSKIDQNAKGYVNYSSLKVLSKELDNAVEGKKQEQIAI